MKIDNSSKTIGPAPSPASPRTAGTRPAPSPANTETSPAGQSTTIVSVALHAVTGPEAPFSSQKVAEIQQAISEGRFQISPERIADGLINSVRQMLDRNRGSA